MSNNENKHKELDSLNMQIDSLNNQRTVIVIKDMMRQGIIAEDMLSNSKESYAEFNNVLSTMVRNRYESITDTMDEHGVEFYDKDDNRVKYEFGA